ncbi:MAG TPA: hypothetical protein VLZ83_14245 [Edaphocola sp.]|nr:hypothetical protein [Edaphocola sp.]
MKKYLFSFFVLVLLGAFSFQKCFAQSEKYEYTPKLFQSSLRIGLVNASLNGAYRLNQKTLVMIDLGLRWVYLFSTSESYNKYNYDYARYNNRTNDWWNFGDAWFSPYSSLMIKRILRSQSKIEYTSSPYANTYTYIGAELKGNAPSIFNGDSVAFRYKYRESYQSSIMIGRQVELGKDANFVFDFYGALGLIINYKIEYVEPTFSLGVRMGVNLFGRQ